MIPNIFANGINQFAEDELQAEINNLSSKNQISNKNLLISRLSLFNDHSENDIDETFAIKEREYMKGSFSLSRFMVWAIPIMGFIGTVWGISNGISHFSDAMTSTNSVTDVTAMLKESLPLVTSSLATAFDTTLLALLLSIPLMMLMLSIEKDEEAYLIELDEKWFHSIKPLLQQHSNYSQNFGKNTENTEGVDLVAVDNTQAVANEITLLSTQIKALQETMEDLYETVFTSKLNEKKINNMAMSRANRYARYRQEDKLEISLFPFLSIFLCVMGVLSFINVLNSFSTPQKIELTAQLEQGYKVAYQIFSLPDGIISVPPTKNLLKLVAVVDDSDALVIKDILERRNQTIDRLEASQGSVMNLAEEPDMDDTLETILDIRTINEIALKANYLYEEFLLFGIYPNGGSAYQKIRDVMSFTQDAAAISVGLEPLDSNWTLNLNSRQIKAVK